MRLTYQITIIKSFKYKIMEGIFVPIAMFAMIFGIVAVVSKKKERIAMIEKGIDDSSFAPENLTMTILKYGIFLIGIAVGLLIGNLIASYTSLNEVIAYLSMVSLWGGLALLVYYFIAKKKNVRKFYLRF